jgi:hypothetical protein
MEQLGWKYQSRVFDLRFGSVLPEYRPSKCHIPNQPFSLFHSHTLYRFLLFISFLFPGGITMEEGREGRKTRGGGKGRTWDIDNRKCWNHLGSIRKLSNRWEVSIFCRRSNGLAMICYDSTTFLRFFSSSLFCSVSLGGRSKTKDPKKFEMWHFDKTPAFSPVRFLIAPFTCLMMLFLQRSLYFCFLILLLLFLSVADWWQIEDGMTRCLAPSPKKAFDSTFCWGSSGYLAQKAPGWLDLVPCCFVVCFCCVFHVTGVTTLIEVSPIFGLLV